MEKNKRIELSEVLKDPEMAKQIQDVIRYVENTPFSKMFPEKYENSIERLVAQRTRKLFKEQPHLPLKDVVSTVLTSLQDDLSAALLLKMTRVIIEEWEYVSTTVYTHKGVEELV